MMPIKVIKNVISKSQETNFGSFLLLTRLTKVSISASDICFSKSFLLFRSRDVIVSSVRISHPICVNMKGNSFAIYSLTIKVTNIETKIGRALLVL